MPVLVELEHEIIHTYIYITQLCITKHSKSWVR